MNHQDTEIKLRFNHWAKEWEQMKEAGYQETDITLSKKTYAYLIIMQELGIDIL